MIYVMNHRSNVDYVLAAHVLSEKLALSFAVGEWARVWPLEYLFKAFGSYFLRRGFRDPLYHTILRRYVQLVTKNGVTQALFPEGGLSRDGKLRSPKLGLLDYIVCSKEDRSFERELIFIPVAINYDRVLEDRALVAEARDERKRQGKPAMLQRVLGILFGNALKFARSEIRKNGIAAVRFGEPLSFDEWHAALDVDIFSLPKDERRAHIADLCNQLVSRIAERIPATPLCLVAKVLLERAPLPRAGLDLYVRDEIARLQELGVEVVCADRGPAWMVEGALLRFGLRGLLIEDDGDLVIPDEQRPILTYYANALAHFDEGAVPTVELPTHMRRAAS
jgi:glycerol-3-phosphate O-acyltransferase